MPLRDKAQMRKFFAMLNPGEISHEQVRRWQAETPRFRPLPEKIKKSRRAAHH